MKKIYCSIAFLLFIIVASAQNTVGVLRNDTAAYNAYALFSPNNSTETYLINNCGEVVHQWTSAYIPGASVYLLENGNLLRTAKLTNDDIQFGGVGGKIELFDWDNNLLWEYTYSSSTVSQHHDIFPLPNGNILMLAVTTMTQNEAILAGRDPVQILDGKIYNEQVLELEPEGTDQANIVWEWNIKDHLIQDFDNTRANYGVISDHPELLDFNFLNGFNGGANWLHINSVQYNALLDQIILSSRHLSEVYIIDHSTSTAEAASHSGGNYGKGGDLLYRWGNPEAYDMGDSNDRTLFGQHYPHWIPLGLDDEGKILIFNNAFLERYSTVDIISPPTDAPGVYSYDSVDGYGPTTSDWTYIAPNPDDLFSGIMSSAQRLPNGNTLICDGDSGYFFEIDATNTIVWEYVNPDSSNGILSQGDAAVANLVFRVLKFPFDYPAFTGRDLTPGDPIELNPDLSNCTLLSTTDTEVVEIEIFPNPVMNSLNINYLGRIDRIEVYSLLGQLVTSNTRLNKIDLSAISKGLYIVKIDADGQSITKKIIKQ